MLKHRSPKLLDCVSVGLLLLPGEGKLEERYIVPSVWGDLLIGPRLGIDNVRRMIVEHEFDTASISELISEQIDVGSDWPFASTPTLHRFRIWISGRLPATG